MQKKVCKFDISDMLPIGLTFVVLGIGIAYGLNVISDVKLDIMKTDSNFGAAGCTGVGNGENCTDASVNATSSSIEGVAKIPEKMPLIATVVVAAIIIGILVRYLMMRFG